MSPQVMGRRERGRGVAGILRVVALGFLAACDPSGMPVTPGTEGAFPAYRTVVDGSTSGNPDFWFLPPVAESPLGEREFDRSEFNPNLFPLVDICEVDADDGSSRHGFSCMAPRVTGGAAELSGGKYRFKYQTDVTDANHVFLVTVRLGETELGAVHMVLGDRGGNVTVPLEPGDYLVNGGSEADLVFSVENDALCIARDPSFDQDTDECTSVSLDLDHGGRVGPVSSTVSVAPGTTAGGSSSATFTFEDCDAAWPLDTPTFGECFHVTVEEGAVTFDPPTIVYDCRGDNSFDDEPYHDYLRLYQFTEEGAEALPEASVVCDETVGALPQATSFFGRLASGVRSLVGPQPLSAAALLHRGGGGEVGEYDSNFIFSISARMTVSDGDGLAALVGTETSTPPSVLVEWLYTENPPGPLGVGDPGGPLSGATITFDVTGGGGSLDPGAKQRVAVTTGADGLAGPDAWTLGPVAGLNTVVASAFGISGEGDDPFFDVDDAFPIERPDQVGSVTFTAGAFNQIAQQAGGPVIGIEELGDGTETVESFYGYGTGASRASSNTGLEREGTSLLFFFDGSDRDGLVMIHDAPGGKAGCADLAFSGMAGLDFIVRDDANDKYATAPLTAASWGWNRNESDGAALTVDRAVPQDIVITPGFTSCSPPRGGARISAWTLLSGSDSHALDRTKALTIRGR